MSGNWDHYVAVPIVFAVTELKNKKSHMLIWHLREQDTLL